MSRKKKVYCAFCRSEHQTYVRRGVGLGHILASLVCAILATLACFQEFDPRGFFFFMLFLAVAEIFLRLRWRIQIVCKQCGFDPVLYLKDSVLASQKVKIRLAERQSSADYLLAQPLNLPVLTPEKKSELLSSESGRGRLISQRI